MKRFGKATVRQILFILCLFTLLALFPLPFRLKIKTHRKHGCARAANGSVEVRPEVTRIFYLKAHKCASTTIQNVLQRFGYNRGLDFAIPWKANYLGNGIYIREWMIGNELRTIENKYDLLVHHTRYSRKVSRRIMKPGTKFITMLREPADQFESLFKFYRMDALFRVNMENLTTDPEAYKKIGKKRISTRIGFNQMSWDLGLRDDYFHNPEMMAKFIKKIDDDFDLVLMVEHFEVSLVILADFMNWPLENVAYVRSNWRADTKRVKLTEKQKDRLRELNWADTQLYKHFSAKFAKLVASYGYERLERDVRRLIKICDEVQRRCVENRVRTGGYGKGLIFMVKEDADQDCPFYVMEDDEFTLELRRVQIKRSKRMQALNYAAIWSEEL